MTDVRASVQAGVKVIVDEVILSAGTLSEWLGALEGLMNGAKTVMAGTLEHLTTKLG